MIAGRVDAMDGDSARGAEGARRHLLEWLEGGQEVLTQVSRLCDELEHSRAEAATADRECARLRDDIALLRRDNDALKSDNAQLAGELARLRSDRAHLEAEAATIRNHNALLMDERGATAKLIADKLEDMLAQVLPRLAKSGPSPAEAREPEPRAAAPAPAAPALPPVTATPVSAPPTAAVVAPAVAPAAPTGAPVAIPAPVVRAGARSEEPPPAAPTWLEPEMPGAGPALGQLDRPEPDEPADAGEPTRVLVVDDETDFTELLHDHLGASGYEVVVASNGEDALSLIETFQPRVVFLDMMMAGIGGMETLRRIKATRPDTSVIMITALDDRDVARKALAAGAADYLTKPLSLDFLDSALALHAAGPLSVAPSATVELVTVAAPTPGARRTFFGRA